MQRSTGMARRRVVTLELENLVAAASNASAAGRGEEAVGAALAVVALLERTGPLPALLRVLEEVDATPDLPGAARV
ncbi:MAG: hypothetical protein GY898_08185 [Proteobacteria bacterium]|nr:hypothetical protein [Pseudomonadota bacterium]